MLGNDYSNTIQRVGFDNNRDFNSIYQLLKSLLEELFQCDISQAWSPYSRNDHKYCLIQVFDSDQDKFSITEHFACDIASTIRTLINCLISPGCKNRKHCLGHVYSFVSSGMVDLYQRSVAKPWQAPFMCQCTQTFLQTEFIATLVTTVCKRCDVSWTN